MTLTVFLQRFYIKLFRSEIVEGVVQIFVALELM